MKDIVKKRKKLYMDYCYELLQYDPVKHYYVTVKTRGLSVFYRYIRKKCFVWHDIYNDNHELIGFLITAKDLNIHGAGLYICESYIKIEYRGKGFMEEAVTNACKDYKGYIYLEIFDRNKIGQRFWGTVMSNIGCSLVSCSRSISGISELSEFKYIKEQ